MAAGDSYTGVDTIAVIGTAKVAVETAVDVVDEVGFARAVVVVATDFVEKVVEVVLGAALEPENGRDAEGADGDRQRLYLKASQFSRQVMVPQLQQQPAAPDGSQNGLMAPFAR